MHCECRPGLRLASFQASYLESDRPNPEAFPPALTWWNTLQLLVSAAMRKVQGIRNSCHRLEADEVAIERSEDNGGAILGTKQDFESLRPACYRHQRAP